MQSTEAIQIYPKSTEEMCPFCKKPRKRLEAAMLSTARYKPCTCEGWIKNQAMISDIEEEEERKRQARAVADRARKLHAESGLLDFDLTFDSPEINGYPVITDRGNEETIGIARFFAEHFPSAGRSLFLTGFPGAGKTTTACMVGNEVLRQGRRVEYFTCVDLLRSVTPHMQSNSGDKLKAQARREGLFRSPLIILDDPGKADWTPALKRLLYEVIDKRERSKRNGIVIAAKEDFCGFTSLFGDWQMEIARRLNNMEGSYGGGYKLGGSPIVNGVREEAGGMY